MFSNNQSNFISLCAKGQLLPDKIDDYIDEWHDSSCELELYDYLGMTQKEYRLWVHVPDILWLIITAKKQNCSIDEVLSNVQQKMRMTAKVDSTNHVRH